MPSPDGIGCADWSGNYTSMPMSEFCGNHTVTKCENIVYYYQEQGSKVWPSNLGQIGSIDPHQDNWINSTLVTHYELICDRTSLVKNAKSFQMAGNDCEDLVCVQKCLHFDRI